MKRSGFIQRYTSLKAKTRIRVKGVSERALVSEDIQAFLLAIVKERDGGCVLRDVHYHGIPECNGYAQDGHLILQAEHLIERSNGETFADSRLVVCICKGHHGWKHFKKSNHDQYDLLVRAQLSEDRVQLWDRCREDKWRPTPTSTYDLKLALAALKQELRDYVAA